MQLSDDGKILLHVTNGDIHNGMFTFPNSVTSIGAYAFRYCSSLTQATIPNGVTSIDNGAFEFCSSLTQVTILDGVTSIGSAAFSECDSLMQITIPNSVTSIGEHAFSYCENLAQLTIPDGVIAINDGTFNGCQGLTQVTIPNSVTSIGNYAFRSCTSLTQATIPHSVTSIGYSAFQDCSSLTQVTIPDGVIAINSNTFWGCQGLTQVTIPNSVTSIGESIFEQCTSLEAIMVNTNSNEKLETVRIFLPPAYRTRVIQKQVYEQVLAHQQEMCIAVRHAFGPLNIKESIPTLFIQHNIPSELIMMISYFDQGIYQAFKQVIQGLIIPSTAESFNVYKRALEALVSSHNQSLANAEDTVEHIARTTNAISKLRSYTKIVRDDKQRRSLITPQFFTAENTPQQESIEQRLSAVHKAIRCLEGDNVMLSQQEKNLLLNSPVIANILRPFISSLPQENNNALMVNP